MKKIIELFLFFTHRSPTTLHKVLALIPGTVLFLVISPLFLFFFSRYLSSFMPVSFPRVLELIIGWSALSIALILMNWGFVALWFDGRGSVAPITPTKTLVTIGPYKYTRNPIELGTNFYFLFLGIWFDTLITGILCMVMGMMLGYGYIRLLEEKELACRFGADYQQYRMRTPLFFPRLFSREV